MDRLLRHALLILVTVSIDAAEDIRVLLLSGSNNHAWKVTTPVLVAQLARDPRFQVRVCEDVPALQPGDLVGVDLVVSNYNTFGTKGERVVWDPVMRQAFMEHMQAGRGFVSVHSGTSTWYDWPDFLALSGGRWGKATKHGKQQDAEVSLARIDHPITHGLPAAQVTHDEFWQSTEVIPGIVVLATATPIGSTTAEPMAWLTPCGKTRSFTLLLGHDAAAMAQPLFTALFLRGCQWAATGAVPPLPAP